MYKTGGLNLHCTCGSMVPHVRAKRRGFDVRVPQLHRCDNDDWCVFTLLMYLQLDHDVLPWNPREEPTRIPFRNRPRRGESEEAWEYQQLQAWLGVIQATTPKAYGGQGISRPTALLELEEEQKTQLPRETSTEVSR